MLEFKKLLHNSEMNVQLYRYLQDAQQELSKERSSYRGVNYVRCGELFARAYGLELTRTGMINLGKFIREGKYRPSHEGVCKDFTKLPDSVTVYWHRIVNGV
jgi:hypothetical protein